MTEKSKSVTDELRAAIVAIESAECIALDRKLELADLTAAQAAIERALIKIQHQRCIAESALQEF